MSIEQAIQNLANAIERNTEQMILNRETFLVAKSAEDTADVIDNAKGTAAKKSAKSKPEVEPDKASPESTAQNSTVSTESTEAPSETVAAPEVAASENVKAESSAAVDYDEQLKPKILDLVAKNRDKAVAILAGFGAKKGTDLKPEQHAECYKLVLEALGESVDALA